MLEPNPVLSEGIAERELEKLVQQHLTSGASYRIVTRRGDPAPVIVAVADELNVDLIVMPTHGDKAIEHMILGSVAERVVPAKHRCRPPGDFRRSGRAPRRRGRGTAQARRASANSGGGFDERARRHRHPSSARARHGRARRPLSGQPRHASGRRFAVAGRSFRRPHVELVDPGLLLHHSADQAYSRRHRSGRDRPQLSGRARPDGRHAHLPAPGACRTRSPQGCRQEARRPQEVAGSDRRLSQGMGQTGRAGIHRRQPAGQSAARGVRDSTRAARRRDPVSATSACTTTGCSATASRGVRIR